ncbi:MAG: nucleotide pyrophosphohydrolase [Acidiferrobacterales bacterium]
MTLDSLTEQLRAFAHARDWDQFHSPKNLSMALSVEAAELVEHFQWLTERESLNLSASQREQVALEMADVFIYLLRLADKLDVDLLEIARRKIVLNEQKYPAEKVRGQAGKRKDS